MLLLSALALTIAISAQLSVAAPGVNSPVVNPRPELSPLAPPAVLGSELHTQETEQPYPSIIGNVSAGLTARAVFVVDLTSGALIHAENADVQLPPASTVKIVTALVVRQVLAPDEVIVVQSGDMVDKLVYSNASLEPGDEVTIRDLLAGLLLPSGGDAALALARVTGERLGLASDQDPVERFVAAMNEVAGEIGMSRSQFTNPVGIDDDGQVSTARDLAIAGSTLLRDQVLADLVARSEMTFEVGGPFAREITVTNTNQLLPAERVHGVKTGTTAAAGQCLVLATMRSDAQILTVVLGSEDRYADTQQLMDFVDDRVAWVTFNTDSFPSLSRAAERYEFTIPMVVIAPMPRQEAERVSYRLELGQRPSAGNAQSWGLVVFLNGGREIYRFPVFASWP
jgi:serine-type D-Ala-D-Ala carboxypeptidase (penicillin-binding protein 5/6)